MNVTMHDSGVPECAYFAGCHNACAGVTEHPVLSYVPTCEDCAARFGLVLIPAEWDVTA